MVHMVAGWCRPPSVLVCCLQLGERRMKRTEIVTKLIAGTAAFYLGKKVIVALSAATMCSRPDLLRSAWHAGPWCCQCC